MEIVRSARPGGIVILHAKGKLNMVHAQRLREEIASLVSAGSNRIVIDLAAVDFLDSSGLGALIGGLKATRQAGGDLRIAGANEQVLLVLQLTNLDRVLTPYANSESAFESE